MLTVWNHKAYLALAMLFLQLVSCGSGGGGGGGNGSGLSSQYVDVVTPSDGSGIDYGAVPTFLIHNANTAQNGSGVYDVIIYSDGGAVNVLASVSGIIEDSNGSAIWASGLPLNESRQYWWKWKAVFDAGNGPKNVESDLLTFFVVKNDAGQSISPRSGGYMDVNSASFPVFAVLNAYTLPDANVTYDMELYSDAELTALVAYVSGVKQDDGEAYTTFFPGVALDSGRTYYWLARPVINGQPLNWRGVFPFTVKNLCEIPGSRYAQNAISVSREQNCSVIAFNDPAQALGPPNGSGHQPSKYGGFISLSRDGSIVLEMGRTVINRPGDDLRVWEYVSTEELEVFAGQSEIGPWFSLGVEGCGVFCDFDLGRPGLNYARFIKIKDISSLAGSCHETSGADIDAVYALGAASSSSQCASF